jgi:hypothetical protein
MTDIDAQVEALEYLLQGLLEWSRDKIWKIMKRIAEYGCIFPFIFISSSELTMKQAMEILLFPPVY